MGMRNANPVPAFLPRDNAFRYAQGDPAVDIPRIYELINQNSAETERRVGLMKNSLTRSNYLLNGWFRQYAASGVPLKWTSAGAGVTFSTQITRTGGLPNGKAARIAAGAGAAGTLTQVVNIGWGPKWSVTGWVKVTAGTGQITLTPNGTNPRIEHVTVNATDHGGWVAFPSTKLNMGMVELPTDATQVTIELRANVSSTVDFAEIQLGPGTSGYPTMYVKAPEDVTEIVTIGTLPTGYGVSGQFIQTNGSGTTTFAGGHVYNETPSGIIDGNNTVFTLATAPNPPDSLLLFVWVAGLGYLQLANGVNYQLAGTQITFGVPSTPPVGSLLVASYTY